MASQGNPQETEQVSIVLPKPETAPAAQKTQSPDDGNESIPLGGGSSSWPMFHGDIGRRGWSNAPSIKQPAIKWRAHIGIQGWLNSPVISGEMVLVPSSGSDHNVADAKDGLYAFSLRTGKRLWHTHLHADANGAAAVGGRVIVGCDNGYVYSIELESGRIRWIRTGPAKVYSHPLPIGNFVVVGDAGGTLRALSLEDGTPLWTAQLKGEIRGGASADEALIYAVSTGGEAIALQWDGKEVWRQRIVRPGFGGGRPLPIQVYSPPIVSGSTIILPFARDTYYDDPALMAIDKKTGRTVWMASGDHKGKKPDDNWGNIRSTPVLSDSGQLIYAEPYSGDIAVIDSRTGSVKARRTVGACFFPQWASPAAASDTVYVPRFDGVLYAIQPSGAKVSWQFYLGEESRTGALAPAKLTGSSGCSWDVPVGYPLYSPAAVADDGTVLVGSSEGVLYAIGEKQ